MDSKQLQLSVAQKSQYYNTQAIKQQDQQSTSACQVMIKAIRADSFIWKIVRFIILTYYLSDAILLLAFPSFYEFSFTTLLPLNIIFYILLFWDFFIKVLNLKPLPPKKTPKTAFRRMLRKIWYCLYTNLLILDLIVIILVFFIFIFPYSSGKYMRLFVFLRVTDLIIFNNEIYFIIYNQRIGLKIYTLIKIAFVFFMFSHYFGCIIFLIDQTAIEYEWYGPINQNPLLYYQVNVQCFSPIQSLDDAGRYLYGLYFLVSLISTIAYGDIVGKNPPEQALVTVLMVVSTLAMALILQQVMGVLVQSFGFYEFIKKYNSLKSYMDSRKVGLDLQNRVRSYLVYIQYQKQLRQQEPIIDKISLKLKKQIFFSGYKQRIGVLFDPIIKKQSNIFQLCNLIQEVTFHEEAQLFQPKVSLEENYLYQHLGYLSQINGRTLIYVQYDKDSAPIVLGERKQYNFYELLTKTSTRYGVVAKSLSHFAKISTAAFQRFLQSTNTELIMKCYAEKMLCCEISETKTQQYCLVCHIDGHSNYSCPKMHLVHRNKDLLCFDKSDPAIANIIDIQQNFSMKSRMHQRENIKRTNLKCKKTWPRKIEASTEHNIFSILIGGVAKHQQQIVSKISENKNETKQVSNGINEEMLYIRSLMNVNLLAHNFVAIAGGGNLISILTQGVGFDSIYDPKGLQENFKVANAKDDQMD